MKCQSCKEEPSKVWVTKGGIATRVCHRCEEELVELYNFTALDVPPSKRKHPPQG